jgi:hypothetical protein
MRQVEARRNFLLLHDDGSIHYPFSRYLTNEFTNPNTRELVAQSLRIFYRFLTANRIELAIRATEGRCLTDGEASKLVGLCYRPLPEVEDLSDRKVISIMSSKAGKASKDLIGAVEANTARKRLNDIAVYLERYREVFLDPNIRSESTLTRLKDEYTKITKKLKREIRGTKQGHHHQIQSLPTEKFQAVIKEIYVHPERLFQSDSGAPSRTLYRDRAMALLACEGLRPGSIGNIAINDFKPRSGFLDIVDHRDKLGRPSSGHMVAKGSASTQVNYATETMISLFPLTIDAVSHYIKTERNAVLLKQLANQSSGFLFLSEQGRPLMHRASLTRMFNRLGKRLLSIGLLDVGEDPYFSSRKKYDFYGYVLRHSAATFYCQQKGTDDKTLDSMKIRFGWTVNSKMPQIYAARALSDQANIDMMEFNSSLMADVLAKKQEKGER